MQRQMSMLSFFRKPSPDGDNAGAASYSEVLRHRRPPPFPANRQKHDVESNLPKDVFEEVRGTDTPPAKPQRQVLPLNFPHDGGTRSFSSIMDKLRKKDDAGCSEEMNQGQRNPVKVTYINENKIDNGEGFSGQATSLKQVAPSGATVIDLSFEDEVALDFDSIGDVPWPDTPAMKPLVPRLKRIQDDNCKFSDEGDFLLADSSKRLKSLPHLCVERSIKVDEFDSFSGRFEWLNSSSIRDSNGRRPSDALYDKRTLYIPTDALEKMSASQKQYWSTKCQYMDVVLFFKVGKFYELYELDAEIGHRELDWKMTYSGVGKCRQVGISESGIEDAIQKLIARGYKVGRMEQVETSGQAKARGASVIQRKLVRIYTPSTTVDGNVGPDAVHLLALKEGNSLETGSTAYGFAFLDYAALKFWVGSICDDASCSGLGTLLLQVSPKEVMFESKGLSVEAQKAIKKYASPGSSALQLTPVLPGTHFLESSEVREQIQSRGLFRSSSNSWFSVLSDISHKDLATSALGGLLVHLSRLKLDDALYNGDILPYEVYENCMRLDGQTLMNLEIFQNNADGGSPGTLYSYLGNCITSSGKRLLRNWICHPLKNLVQVNHRLNVVDEFMKHPEIMLVMAQCLRRLPDLERLLGQVKASIGSSALLLLPLVGERILKQRVKTFVSLVKGLRIALDLLNLIQKEDIDVSSLSQILYLPSLNGSGGLDGALAQLEAAVDEHFSQHKDHVVKERDAERLAEFVEIFAEEESRWSKVIHALSCMDVLRSFAVTANSSVGPMCRPVLICHNSTPTSGRGNEGPVLKLKGLWHPYAVGDREGGLVPNDVFLGGNETEHCARALLLTGPNMGGKSTLLRATCLAVLLSQLGCFVPCEMCVLSPVDTIFTRLGATDRIMNGESTFLIECMETASVLQNATENSLVLLDELGRGTSTYDGYAIAYAVSRHLIEKVHCRLLFATHYHPLTKEFASHPHVSLQHMACAFKPKSGLAAKNDQELVFLYRLSQGACPESYGLQVARMAGIPEPVVKAASRAGAAMKSSVGETFKSSESRSEFSSLHEEWFKTLLAISSFSDNSGLDEDGSDTLLCLWHELNSICRSQTKL